LEDGIAAVQNRLKAAGDGRPRLTVDPSCVETVNEFESYRYKPGTDRPVDEFDHALDALRYLHDVRAVPTGAISDAAQINSGGADPRLPAPRVFVPRVAGRVS
jgi:hypothetical protein